MAEINVYEQYFEAECTYNDVERKGALVMLISTSEAGTIRYEAAVTFFPHREEDDYAVSYDAYFAKELYAAAEALGLTEAGIFGDVHVYIR